MMEAHTTERGLPMGRRNTLARPLATHGRRARVGRRAPVGRHATVGRLAPAGGLAPVGRLAGAARLAGSSLAIVCLVLACAPDLDSTQNAAVRTEPASRFGDYGDDSPASFDGRNRYSVYVPMKDGTRIAVDYYLPTADAVEASEPLPVVLHYTRYIRAFEDEEGAIHTPLDGDPVLQHLSRHGYAIAVADALDLARRRARVVRRAAGPGGRSADLTRLAGKRSAR